MGETGTLPTDVALLPTTAPTCGSRTTGLDGGRGSCTLKAATGAEIMVFTVLALPLPLPLEPVGVLGDDDDGDVDCDEELAAD